MWAISTYQSVFLVKLVPVISGVLVVLGHLVILSENGTASYTTYDPQSTPTVDIIMRHLHKSFEVPIKDRGMWFVVNGECCRLHTHSCDDVSVVHPWPVVRTGQIWLAKMQFLPYF